MPSRNQKAPVVVQPVDIQRYKDAPAGAANPIDTTEPDPANTKYVFLITNLTADANVHDITIDWYEHENKAE